MTAEIKLLPQVAAETPGKLALIAGDDSATYLDLLRRVGTLAAAMRNTLKLVRGDRMCVLLHNVPEAIETSLAAAAAGIVAIPVNYRSTADELSYILSDSGAKALVFGPEFAPVIAATAKPAGLVTIVTSPDAPADFVFADLATGQHGTPPERSLDPATSLRYTSGTTGQPKAARRDVAPAASLQIMRNFVDEFDYRSDEVHLTCCPLYHSAPPVFANMAITVGGTLVLQEKFSAEAWLAAVAEHKVTSAFVVPTILQRLVDVPSESRKRFDTSSLRTVIVAAAKCPPQLKLDATAAVGEIFYEFYGSTEGSINTIVKPKDFARKPDSCGRAFAGNRIRVVAENGSDCPVGVAGEICVKNANVIGGYENAPEKTRESFTADGYYRSGDIGYVDDEGFYFIVDRIKDMIISGGVNIYPAEIEQVLRQHPDVRDVAVVGIPDPAWGESVKAVVVLKPASTANEAMLRQFADAKLADYKRPRHYEFRDELPYTPEGKLRKRDLR